MKHYHFVLIVIVFAVIGKMVPGWVSNLMLAGMSIAFTVLLFVCMRRMCAR